AALTEHGVGCVNVMGLATQFSVAYRPGCGRYRLSRAAVRRLLCLGRHGGAQRNTAHHALAGGRDGEPGGVTGLIAEPTEQTSGREGMFRDGLLRGRRILVTGGGTGLGKGMAEKFLALGAELFICGRRKSVCDETAAELMAKHGGKVTSYGVDIRDA